MAGTFPFLSRKIVLASSSPRRKDLLGLIRIPHVIVHPQVVEENYGYEDPVAHVLRLSRLKALSVKPKFTEGFILGADTTVVLDGNILGKPEDPLQAKAMLRKLSGRRHEVYTGLTLIDAKTGKEVQGYERTSVKIRRLSLEEIDAYVATGEPLDKAGSYGIQGYGAGIVEKIEGCYFNVVGLPIVRLVMLVRELERICGG